MKKEITSSLFSHLETTENAMFSSDNQGMIALWSQGCESLFGYSKEEVQSQFPPVFVSEDSYNDYYAAVKRVLSGETFSFTMRAQRQNGQPLQVRVHVSPIRSQDRVINGYQGFFQLINSSASSKRTFSLIRNTILLELQKGEKTINQIGVNTNINWKTVEKHLTFLLGKNYVQEIFSSRFVRIFGITSKGKEYLKSVRKNLEVRL